MRAARDHRVVAARLGGLDRRDQKVGIVGAQQVRMFGLQVDADAVLVFAVREQVAVGREVPVPSEPEFVKRGVVGVAMEFGGIEHGGSPGRWAAEFACADPAGLYAS